MRKIVQLYMDNQGSEKRPVNLVMNGADASIYIYDVIEPTWGVSALSVAEAVANAAGAKNLHVYINSPGGDVFEGRAIMAVLNRFQGNTFAHIDSLCASAATSIALACDEVEMSPGAFFMIHNAKCMADGDKAHLREVADLLEKVEGSIIDDYVEKTKKDAAEIVAMMDAETWMTAAEAVAHGFVNRITDNATAKTHGIYPHLIKLPESLSKPDYIVACMSVSNTKKAPIDKRLINDVTPPPPTETKRKINNV